VKDNDGEKGDGDARYDEVDGVKERLAADGDVEGDVGLRRLEVVVASHVLAGRHFEYVPLHAAVEVLQVDAVGDHHVRGRRPV